MNYQKSSQYDFALVKELIMGPNPIKLLEELYSFHSAVAEDTVLDLGCGRGLTSMYTAKECGSRVFAADLWVTPTENYKRFKELGYSSDRLIPIKAEAHALPFAEEFFDVVTCVDSYHYYGLDKNYLGEHLLPLVKKGGWILIAVPGMIKDIHSDIPEELLKSWSAEDLDTLHDVNYWKDIISSTQGIEIVALTQMESFEECWNDWLACDNEYAINDRKAMGAGAGKYMNFVAIVIRKK